MSSDESDKILLLGVNSILFARVKDERPPAKAQARKEFVEIKLLENLYLNHSKRQYAYLENCACYINDLQQEAISVNHAYTLISTEFEIRRRTKGGNVFNKVYARNYSGELTPLRTFRAAALATLPKIESDSLASITDLTPITPILNEMLFDEAQSVESIHRLIDRCELATGTRVYGSERKSFQLAGLYQAIFNQFKDSLRTMNLGPLICGRSGRLDHFLRGAWSGFFLDEINGLVERDSDFARLVIDACNRKAGTAAVNNFKRWIRFKYRKDVQS